MNKKKLKGLWIPVEILLNKELTDKEKIILSIITYLSVKTKSCFASNKYIANMVNVTPDRVSKIISSLRKKKYIVVKIKYKTDSKEIESRQIIIVEEKINRYSQNHLYPIGENTYLTSSKHLYPIGETDKDIIYTIKNKNIYNKKTSNNKNNKPNYEQRDYTNYDFTKLYANAESFIKN